MGCAITCHLRYALPFLSNIPRMAIQVEGSIIVLNLYDVAEEIRLSGLPPLTGGTPLSPTFKHPAPEYVRFGGRR